MQMIDSVSALHRLHELEFSSDKGISIDAKQRKLKEIERCENELPPNILHRYKTAKRRYGKTAVVAMNNRICQGCFISTAISAQPIDSDIYRCEHCGRLMIDAGALYSSGFTP